MKRVKVGLIGTGRIGKLHVENLSVRIPAAEVVAVADPFIEGAKEVAAKFDINTVTSDYKEILSIPEVEAVFICSPTDTHAQCIMEAAVAGKHIFCEKPLDLSLDKIRMVLDAVEKAGVKLMVGFNRRFDPNFAKVQQMVKAGKVGIPHILKITSRDPEPPPAEYVKVSGGIFLDMTIHDFDMTRFVLDTEVTEVYAKATVLIDPAIGKAGDADTAITTLFFENGAIGSIDNSRKAVYGYDQRLEVFGSEGMVMIDNNTPDNHTYYNKKGSHGSLPLNFFMDRYVESYSIETESFIDAVVHDKEVPVSGKDGLMSVAIGLAARKSVIENRPVKLNEIL
ncbi:MAG: inositol 2-dehydrogenase [Chlorobi bacterium]|nr:inositol 2-dehydrogenase [Chlorobiota bacterium]